MNNTSIDFIEHYLKQVADLQVLILLVISGLVGFFLENFFPLKKQPFFYRRKDFLLDLILFLIGFSAAPFLNYLTLVFISNLYLKVSQPYVFRLELSGFLGFILIFLTLDFIKYWIHRLQHTKAFWNFHVFHHSAENLDWLTSERVYFLDDWLTSIATTICLLFVNLPHQFFLYFLIISRVSSFINHANVNLSFGSLDRYIFNPLIHRWHHAKFFAHKNGQNFGGVLLIWDHLFGTYYYPNEKTLPELGVIDSEKKYTNLFYFIFLAPKQFVLDLFKKSLL